MAESGKGPAATRAQRKSWLEALGLHRKELRAWALYDWGNSAFATTMMAAVLPIFYYDVAAAGLGPGEPAAKWGYTQAISLAIVTLLAPILGAVADYLSARLRFLTLFMSMGVIGSVGLYFVARGDYVLASALYIIGSVGFYGGNVFYESLLPHLAKEEEIDRVSTAGFALGYVGGGVLLAINVWWILDHETFGFADKGVATRLSFVSVGVWWLLFSIPLLFTVPEPGRELVRGEGKRDNPFFVGFKRLYETFRNIRKFREIVIFLIAFWLYSDGIGTIYKMATIYGREIGIQREALIGAILLVQFVGIPMTFAYAPLAARFGTRPMIIVALSGYTVVCALGYFMTEAWHFWILAMLVAMFQGGAQALSRSLYASMVPKALSSEFFGFYSVSSKFAGIFGPLIFAVMADLAGGSRASILFLVAFFVLGIIVLCRVDIERGKAAALATERHWTKATP